MEILQEKSEIEICSHVKTYCARSTAFHWHDRYEICQPINKPCNFLIDGEMIEAGVGDIVTIDQKTVHSFHINNDNTDVLIIQFPFAFLLNVKASIKPLKAHITKKEINAIPDMADSVNAILELMKKEYREVCAKENPYFQSLCVSLYFLLMRHFPADGHINATSKDRNDFYAITEYINQHFTEAIDVNTIASKTYISRGRLTSLFSKYSGVGLNEYINSLRIKNANQLIMNGSSITDAALESGFQSIRTFNNAYKSLMGITPSEFKIK